MRDQRGEIITNRKPAAISQPSNSANYARTFQCNIEYEQVYAPPQQQQVYQQQQHYGSQQNIMQGAQHLDNQPYSPPPPSQQVPQVLTYSQPHQPQLQPIMEVYQPSFVQSPPPQHQPDEVYRAGGRNLLQMENVGIEEINLKYKTVSFLGNDKRWNFKKYCSSKSMMPNKKKRKQRRRRGNLNLSVRKIIGGTWKRKSGENKQKNVRSRSRRRTGWLYFNEPDSQL